MACVLLISQPSAFVWAQDTATIQKVYFSQVEQYRKKGITASDYKQDTLKQFFDYKCEKAKKIGAYFYSIAYPHNDGWICEDYNVATKTLAYYFVYADQELKVLNGTGFAFYPNGNTKGSGQYLNNYKEGWWLLYHENGRLKDSTFWRHSTPLGTSCSFYPSGNINSIRTYDSIGDGSGTYTEYRENGAVKQIGNYTGGFRKEGVWIYYFPDGKVSFIEKFDKDSCVSVQCFNKDGTPGDSCKAEESPQFPGGAAALHEYWSDHIFWPPGFTFESVSKATIWAGFTVAADGSVKNIEILRSIDELFDEQVIKAIKTMPRWKPGKKYHEAVEVTFELPFTFRKRQNW